MKIGDLVWCVYHIYGLPRQGIIIKVAEDMDTFYTVLIEDESHTLASEEIFLKKSDALKYQVSVLKRNRHSSVI